MKGGMSPEEMKVLKAAWKHLLAISINDVSSGVLFEWWKKEPSLPDLIPDAFLAITGIVLNLENDAKVTELLGQLKLDQEKFQEHISAEAYLKFSQIIHGYVMAKLGRAKTKNASSGLTKLLAMIGSEGGIHC